MYPCVPNKEDAELPYSLKITFRPTLSSVDVFLTSKPYVCFEKINTFAVITRILILNKHNSCNVPLIF